MRQWSKATVELIANPSAALGPAEVLLLLSYTLVSLDGLYLCLVVVWSSSSTALGLAEVLLLLCYTLVSLDSSHLCLVMVWLLCTSPHLIP